MQYVLSALFLLCVSYSVYGQTEQPDTVQICPGESTVLRATVATPLDPGGSYIWFRDGEMIGATTAETDSLVVAAPGSYTLVCTNGGGCTSVISDPVVVAIKHITALDDYANTVVNLPVDIQIIVNDIEGCTPIDTPTSSVVALPLHGTLIPSVTGNYTYTPAPGYTGVDSFTYTVMDESGNISNVATVYINVVSDPLAITLAYFNAVKWNNTQSLLTWNTFSEISSAYFTIERSADGKSFDSLGVVQAAGNSNRMLHYEFKDEEPLAGPDFYRLKMVDLDGRFVYSDIRYLYFGESQDIRIYPNPVSSVLYVKTGKDIPGRIQVVDARGSLLQDIRPESATLELDLSTYAAGTYFIKVFTKDNQVLSHKISKL